MILREIINRSSGLTIHEMRCDQDDYYEVVVLNNEIERWEKILTAILGLPRKPKGVKPSEDDLKLTRGSGGIRVNQTLFERSFGDYTIIVKFWPWDDNEHTTIKMAHLS
ncbi:MAG: hypothetical protein ABIK15_05645 [Pseudomonadota bacterium]